MFFPNDYIAMRVAEEQWRDHLQKAETYCLLPQTGVDHQQGWLSRQACWLLSRLGYRLVTLGQRLERYGVPPTASSGEAPRASGAFPFD